MRRTLPLLALVACLLALVGAGCGGGEEAAPTAEEVQGTVDTGASETETAGGGETETAGGGETETAGGGETETAGGGETETEAAGGEGDPAKGKEVFASAGCGSCHTFEAAGSSGTVGPNLDESSPSYELAVDRVTNGEGSMPPFKDQLSEQQIKDVSAFVSEPGES